jgi:hypothetical protein
MQSIKHDAENPNMRKPHPMEAQTKDVAWPPPILARVACNLAHSVGPGVTRESLLIFTNRTHTRGLDW